MEHGRYVASHYLSQYLANVFALRCGKVSTSLDVGFTRALIARLAGLMDDIAAKVYEAMAYHVTQANFNRRVKVVSAWSLQMTANAILSTLRAAMDPMAAHLRELYAEGLPYDVLLPVGLAERV